MFALQDRVTTLVGNRIGREMVIVAARESETRKGSPKVADLMLRTTALQLKPRTLKNEQQEEDLYRQALSLEPNSARVMVALPVRGLFNPTISVTYFRCGSNSAVH